MQFFFQFPYSLRKRNWWDFEYVFLMAEIWANFMSASLGYVWNNLKKQVFWISDDILYKCFEWWRNFWKHFRGIMISSTEKWPE